MTTTIEPSPPAVAPPVRASFVRRHRVKLVLLAVLFLAVGSGALYTWVTLSFSYSDGERVGYVQKLSRKGWVCRTWEGELAMSPVPGAVPQIFPFSLRDDALAKKIQGFEGKKVSLSYEEKKGVPTSCFGETNHFARDVRLLGP